MTELKYRIQSIDLIKIIAMLGVIALHCQLYIPRNYQSTYCLSTISSGFPIPLFFMVSGYLMLGRKPDVKYSAKKIAKIIRFLVEFTIIYWLIFEATKGTSFLTAIKYVPLAMLQEGPLPIFWYFGAMCILYACLPGLNLLYQRYKKFPLKLTFFLFVIENIIFILNCTIGFDQHVIQSLRIWNWLFYFSLGGIIKNYPKTFMKYDVKIWHILILTILFAGGYTSAHYFFILKNTDQSYGSFICTAYAISIFIYCIHSNFQGNKLIKALSPLFLPVYSLHLFTYKYYFKYINLDCLGEIEPIADFIIVAFITLMVSWLIMKTPVIKQIFKI